MQASAINTDIYKYVDIKYDRDLLKVKRFIEIQ